MGARTPRSKWTNAVGQCNGLIIRGCLQPSCCLITLAGVELPPGTHSLFLSSPCPIILSSSSRCTTLSSSHCTGWLLRHLSSPHRLVLLSPHPLLLSPSSHCAAPYRGSWLLCGGLLTKFLPAPRTEQVIKLAQSLSKKLARI
jgi:hypothetical protein